LTRSAWIVGNDLRSTVLTEAAPGVEGDQACYSYYEVKIKRIIFLALCANNIMTIQRPIPRNWHAAAFLNSQAPLRSALHFLYDLKPRRTIPLRNRKTCFRPRNAQRASINDRRFSSGPVRKNQMACRATLWLDAGLEKENPADFSNGLRTLHGPVIIALPPLPACSHSPMSSCPS
jgi:hypothetical protein